MSAPALTAREHEGDLVYAWNGVELGRFTPVGSGCLSGQALYRGAYYDTEDYGFNAGVPVHAVEQKLRALCLHEEAARDDRGVPASARTRATPEPTTPPSLGAIVEIVHLAHPIRGRVVGRAFGDPLRLDIALPGGGTAANIPVNLSLRILAPAA